MIDPDKHFALNSHKQKDNCDENAQDSKKKKWVPGNIRTPIQFHK